MSALADREATLDFESETALVSHTSPLPEFAKPTPSTLALVVSDRPESRSSAATLIDDVWRVAFDSLRATQTMASAIWAATLSWDAWEAVYRDALQVRSARSAATAMASIPRSAEQIFASLAEMLGVTRQSAAEALQIGRTTPIQWSHGRSPQPQTDNRLRRTEALIASVDQYAGREAALAWWFAGREPRFARLKNGELDLLEEEAADLIFSRAPVAENSVAAYLEEVPGVAAEAPTEGASLRAHARPTPRRLKRD